MKIGLQLYSVRDEMERNMDETLRQVKEMGYDYVEFAGYFGKSSDEVKKLLDKYGLKCISVHQGYGVFLEKAKENIQFIQTLGAQFCVIPWMGVENHKGNPRFERSVNDITYVAKILKANGIQMLYHNHDFEFGKYEGKTLLDWLFEAVPLDFLKPEIDTCWVRYAGYSPSEYLEKYSGSIEIVHLKDFVCKRFAQGPVYALIDDSGKTGKENSKEANGFEFRSLGQGCQDFREIIQAAEKNGTQYLIVEQDQSPTAGSLESARQSREYLRTLGY